MKQKGFTYFWTSFTVVESNNEGLSCFVCVSIILKGVLYKLGLNVCLIRLFKSFLQKQWLWRIHKLSSSTVVTKEGNSVLMFFFILYLSSSAGANKFWLCWKVIVQRSSGVFPAVFVIHSGQVPCSWEQILHWASRDIAGCTDRLIKMIRDIKPWDILKAINIKDRTVCEINSVSADIISNSCSQSLD